MPLPQGSHWGVTPPGDRQCWCTCHTMRDRPNALPAPDQFCQACKTDRANALVMTFSEYLATKGCV